LNLSKSNLKALSNDVLKKNTEYVQLKQQVDPHFLFNNLNVLISLIDLNPKKAIEFGHNLSNVYRHYLLNQSEDFVSLTSELQFIKEYLEIYKAKFSSGFSFEIQFITADYYVLSLAVQELIENIFKHNVIVESNPVVIEIFVEDDFLVIKNSKNLKLL
jgi:LytS/YehU family sensor histidine kinase